MKNNVLKMKDETEQMPADVAISLHIQNMFSTYGELKVKETLKELFNLKFVNQKHKNKKAAV